MSDLVDFLSSEEFKKNFVKINEEQERDIQHLIRIIRTHCPGVVEDCYRRSGLTHEQRRDIIANTLSVMSEAGIPPPIALAEEAFDLEIVLMHYPHPYTL